MGDLGLIPGLGRPPWKRERLPFPVFWPGEFHGLYSPWGHKELDTSEWPSLSLYFSDERGARWGPGEDSSPRTASVMVTAMRQPMELLCIVRELLLGVRFAAHSSILA